MGTKAPLATASPVLPGAAHRRAAPTPTGRKAVRPVGLPATSSPVPARAAGWVRIQNKVQVSFRAVVPVAAGNGRRPDSPVWFHRMGLLSFIRAGSPGLWRLTHKAHPDQRVARTRRNPVTIGGACVQSPGM